MYKLNLKTMSKNQIFWMLVTFIVVALIVFVKVIPVWASLTGVVSFGCGVVTGWWGKMFHDKYIKTE